MLDENPKFQLFAPKQGDSMSMWMNITVPDINQTYSKALELGCKEIQPVTELPDYGISNAIFSDPYGYVWLLHQVHKEVSHEERLKLWEEKREEIMGE